MSPDEIERLRVKIEKDPNSRLFLPLAEEYRKSGMPDEAIAVLQLGLERNPGYTSAMVALGRIYLEKSMLHEARDKFEEVVSIVTGNLFAHRKLADIYRELGEKEKALAEYKKVLRLNPKDDEAKECIEALEAESAYPTQPAAQGIEIADSFVAAGEYYKAAEIYRNMLAIDPANKHLMQRLAELKALLKLLGRGEDVLIARLDALLEGIKKIGLQRAG